MTDAPSAMCLVERGEVRDLLVPGPARGPAEAAAGGGGLRAG
jgi:hypothetical protein